MRLLSRIFAALLAACLLAPAAAHASKTQFSLIEDETQLLQRGPAARTRALDDAAALGADGLRSLVTWRAIAPSPNGRRRPRGFNGGNPRAYPAARWDALDDVVRGARARGVAVLLSPSTPVPLWASACKRGSIARRAVCRPSAALFGAFVRALGKRYSGGYADENQGGGILPRVSRWSIGNEPNQPGWLYPQFATRSGITYAAAAVTYRALAVAGLRSLRATGHGREQLLLGETSPIGRVTGAAGTRPVPPATFIRDLLCIDARGAALRGRAARVRGCTRFRRLAVTGYAHHPYTRGGSQPPLTRGNPQTEITISSSARLKRLLDAAARRGRIPRRLPIHYTEYGFQSNPPDRLFGVRPAQQAEYMNESDYIAYRDPRVRTVSQYKLVDDALQSSFQSGLRLLDGTPKPAFAAYRQPLYVVHAGASHLWVYGQIRLAAGSTRAELQNAPLGGGTFATLRTIAVRSRNGSFLVRIPRREGRWRLRWVSPAGAEILSREAVAAAR
jgi:hypothetical protein